MNEIDDDVSVLKRKEEMDYTALKALQDTQNRLRVESSKETHLIAESNHEYNIEQKEFYDTYEYYLARRQHNPPKPKPSEQNKEVAWLLYTSLDIRKLI